MLAGNRSIKDPYGSAAEPTFLSLFSGCGGLDLGFVNAGFKCLLAVDNDHDALHVHASNIGAPTQVVDMASGRPPDEILRSVDAFVCGPPCQGFSSMGGRRIDDPRNTLLVGVAKLAATFMPRLVVIENVLGARSPNHNHYWQEANGLLRSAGYRTTTIELDAQKV